MTAIGEALVERIRRDGPLSYSTFVEAALYDESHGFYAAGGAAGRRGDFLTSVEVGPLFGAVLAQALDTWWIDLGRPEPFVVVEVGAGVGTFTRALVAAAPSCASAWQLVLVERSASLRRLHPVGEAIVSCPSLPEDRFTGVVFANELLDNLAFDLWEHRAGEWRELLVGVDRDGALIEVRNPSVGHADQTWLTQVATGVPSPVDGARVARQRHAGGWLAEVLERVEQGRVVLVDYTTTTAAMAARPWQEWLRTYQGHARGGAPLEDPGSQDVTVEVAVDQLAAVRSPDIVSDQASFLRSHGLDGLVEEGRRLWTERAGIADLAAMKARSRIREAEALTDPSGLGGFSVLEWVLRSS